MQDIYILGSGAMGYLWASYFDNSTPIHFITRNEVKNDFSFEKLPEKRQVIASKTTFTDLSTQQNKINRLIVCTKAFDSEQAVLALSTQLSTNCEILLIQNGMGSQQKIAKLFPQLAIYACSSTEGVFKESNNRLVHAGKGENHIGALTVSANQDSIKSWIPQQLFQWHSDILPILWKKLFINSAINPLTVIYQCKNGGLLSNPIAHKHMEQLCIELDELSDALNLNLSPSLEFVESICQTTSNNYSSMFQDAKNNRSTEINFITGYIVQQCEIHGINCPINQAIAKQFQG